MCLQLRQVCEVEACCEEAIFVCSVAREHQAGKPFIPAHVTASLSPQFELAHWRTVAGNLLTFQCQVKTLRVVLCAWFWQPRLMPGTPTA